MFKTVWRADLALAALRAPPGPASDAARRWALLGETARLLRDLEVLITSGPR